MLKALNFFEHCLFEQISDLSRRRNPALHTLLSLYAGAASCRAALIRVSFPEWALLSSGCVRVTSVSDERSSDRGTLRPSNLIFKNTDRVGVQFWNELYSLYT